MQAYDAEVHKGDGTKQKTANRTYGLVEVGWWKTCQFWKKMSQGLWGPPNVEGEKPLKTPQSKRAEHMDQRARRVERPRTTCAERCREEECHGGESATEEEEGRAEACNVNAFICAKHGQRRHGRARLHGRVSAGKGEGHSTLLESLEQAVQLLTDSRLACQCAGVDGWQIIACQSAKALQA